jgi:hypothetical protein
LSYPKAAKSGVLSRHDFVVNRTCAHPNIVSSNETITHCRIGGEGSIEPLIYIAELFWYWLITGLLTKSCFENFAHCFGDAKGKEKVPISFSLRIKMKNHIIAAAVLTMLASSAIAGHESPPPAPTITHVNVVTATQLVIASARPTG